MSAKSVLAFMAIALAASGCSSTSLRYERTKDGYCIHHATEHFFGVKTSDDTYPAKKCPKGLKP